MAGVSECFGIGSVVSCKTCNNTDLEGEVLAFDPQTKMLILKSQSSSGKPKLNDVHVINLELVGDITVKKEVTTSPAAPLSLNLQRINSRAKNQVEEKRRVVSALKAGVSLEGQSLFLAITKTIEDVSWKGADIVVLKEVFISPPYQLENVRCQNSQNSSSRALQHVRKIVEKHNKDQQTTTSVTSGTGVSSGGTSPLPSPSNK
jgi:hypothetical protein